MERSQVVLEHRFGRVCGFPDLLADVGCGLAEDIRDQSTGEAVKAELRRTADDVCSYYGVTLERVLIGLTEHKMTIIKQQIARRLRDRGLSLQAIGKLMGRDHSTIAYYLGLRKRNWRNGKYRRDVVGKGNQPAD